MLAYKRSITTEREIGTTLYLTSPVKGLIRHGYLLREDLMSGLSEDKLAPDTLTLDETWQLEYPGVYLFFPKFPASAKDQTGFVTAVSNLLKHSDRDQVRFAWFADPDNWSTGLSAPLEIRVSSSNDSVSNTRQIIFPADKYSLRITINNRIYPNAENNGFIFESVDYANSFGAALRTEIKNKLELVLDNEAHQGCFRYFLNMTGKDLDALNVSLDYFYSDQRWGTRKLGYSVFDVKDQNVFWLLQAVFDPLNLLNDGALPGKQSPENFDDLRTGFIFSSTDDSIASPPLATHFRTRYGKQIELSPATTDHNSQNNNVKPAMLTFNRIDTKKNALSMVLQGDFYLGVIAPPAQTTNNPQHFLCGLSGTETISFTAAREQYSGDMIRFHPRKPAFSARFPAFDQTGPSNNLLDDQLTTSWISIRALDTTVQTLENYYYSQPQDASLFRATGNETSANNEGGAEVVFDVFDAPSANLAHSDINTDCFPMVPIAAAPLTSSSKSKKSRRLEYETRIINPSRKLTIDQYTTKARLLLAQSPQVDLDPETLELTTTPQGFLVGFDKTDASKKWQSIILANDQGSGKPPLELKAPPHYVQSAFQTNEQFLVISNPDRETLDYLRHKFQDQINVAEWPFLLDIVGEVTNSNRSTLYRNILIFKFCNHSLVERLKTPELWTQADVFNGRSNLDKLSKWILEYIDNTRPENRLVRTPSDSGSEQHDDSIIQQGYQEFLSKVEDPNWNGIMALQVTLELGSLPEAIKSIVAGIDIKRFAAHHFGIDSNQILSTQGKLTKDFRSSMFGMISYFDVDYQKTRSSPIKATTSISPVAGEYEFKVLELQVLFRNSEISDFNCKIQLSINALFGEPVIKESNVNNGAINQYSIVLEGLYDKHDGHTSYSFRQLSDNLLSLSSTALNSVNVHSIGLSTVHRKKPEDKEGLEPEAEKLITRFALAGHIAMQQLTDFDMFSYDRISFSSLYIDMEFDIDRPQHSKKFTFIPTEITLDPTESGLRADSFVAHFPVTLEAIDYYSPSSSLPVNDKSPPAVTPASLGYQKVEAPLNYNPIKQTWYCLKFNLSLGTMGALAAKAGFDADVLLSWSPGVKYKAAEVWIKTPFSGGGAKQFSIQGVLKLVTQSIRLEKTPNKSEYAMLFTNIKLSLLGLKLPTAGNTLLYLFGDPDKVSTGDASDTGNLAWFGAYKGDRKDKDKALKANKSLPANNGETLVPQQPDQ